jgi:hypothetical protein
MRIFFIIAFISASLFLTAQGKIERSLEPFQQVDIKGGINFVFSASSSYSVEILGKDPQDIITDVKGGQLFIYHKKGKSVLSGEWNTLTGRYQVIVHAPFLEGISTAGSGNISIDGILKSDILEFNVSGSGNVSGKINVGKLTIESAGSSNIRLTGNVEKANVRSSGSGNIQCFDLVVDDCHFSKSGSGNSQITVIHSLDVSISGSGNFTYKGTPKSISSSSAGSGKIKRIQ